MRVVFMVWVFLLLFYQAAMSQGIHLPEKEKPYVFYAHQKGGIALHVNNQMFNTSQVASMPLVISTEMTWTKDFTAGPMLAYFRFIESQKIAKNVSVIENSKVKYHQFFVGVRANYHLTALLEKMILRKLGKEYFDLYIGSWAGYSFVNSNSSKAKEATETENEKFRAGILIGVRSMISKRFGLFLELGPSSYGKAAFGISVKLK